MSRSRYAVLAAILLLFPCCHDPESPPAAPPDGGDPIPVPQSLALEAPAALASLVPPQNPLIDSSGRYLHGAYALEQFAGQRVTRALHRAVFSPVTPPGSTAAPAEVAYAIYGFEMTSYDGDSTATLCWRGQAPVPERVFVGLGNFAQGRWNWFVPPAQGPVALPGLGPYLNAHPYLLLAVALLGDQPAVLDGVQIGSRWMVRGVDMSLLCAPVMQFEADALEADWNTRNPVANEFEQVGELADPDGTRRIVVSHRVDGRKHYGGVVVPPVEDFEKLPVLVMCHPGAGGTSWTDEGWFFGMLGDSTLRRRFVVVIPSFRGELLAAGALGRFLSEGRMSVFDRDADDAIALLDCVLQYFPNADPSLVLSTGWSRGGQVAMRIAQRDPRIRGAIDFCGMSDEWTINGQGYMREFFDEKHPEPDPSEVYYHALWDLQRRTCDVWQARAVLLRSCIVYQAARLPKLQIHHGVLDPVVPIHEADRLAAVLATIHGADYEYFRYEAAGHPVPSMTGAGALVAAFLRSFLE